MKKIINRLNEIINIYPKICIILGSGLDVFIDSITEKKIIPYASIDGFLKTNVSGHKGEFIYGLINNIPILCANGRFHYYEGYSFDQVGIFINIFNQYAPKKIIITNSSGCLRHNWNIGEFMIVNKFIDFSFINTNKPKEYVLQNNNLTANLDVYLGTYTYTIGPTYETKAEIDEIITLGGDVVGMSTFPEYLACQKLNINPLIISCLTNYGAGLSNKKVEHIDVLLNATKAKNKFNKLIIKLIENIGLQRIQKK
jgi:purine-nucleoside phosphorylase